MMKVWSTACTVALICLATKEVQCSSSSSADDSDSPGEASVPTDNDSIIAGDGHAELFDSSYSSPARNRLLLERMELEDNMSDLQRQFFASNGRHFTQDELGDAITEAGRNLPPRDDPSFPSNRWMYMRDVPEHERRRLQREHDQRRLADRNLATIRKGNMFIVSHASPGYTWNAGRNLFWCAAVKKVARTQVQTQRRQKMTLKNCYTTDEKELIINYNEALEMVQQKLDRVFYDWCLEVDAIRIDQPVRLNHCNIYADTQLWEMQLTDGTWRPELDPDLCVTCKYGQCSSQNPAQTGSTLRFMPCLPEAAGPNPHRTGQSWGYCYLGTNCKIASNGRLGTDAMKPGSPALSCNIEEVCEGRR